ncbi:hypothetical protein NL676_018236 [Syzygium grande]|nr:hypothetical protein NL676_018236 [Syzygium grande]
MGGQRWFTTAGQQRQGTLSKAKGSGARFLARQGPSIGFARVSMTISSTEICNGKINHSGKSAKLAGHR